MSHGSVQIRIGVDLRVEALMAAIAAAIPRLPDGGWIDHPIRRRIRRASNELRPHRAPQLVRALLSRHFWVDDLIRLALTFLEQRNGRLAAPAALQASAPTVLAGCERVASALVDFANDLPFDEFAEAFAEVGREVAESVGGTAGVEACQRVMTAALGPGPSTICVTPSPMLNAHLGFGPTIGPPIKSESWIVFGPVWRPRHRPWALVGFSSRKLYRIVRHELGHAHLNPLTHRAATHVAQYGMLFVPLAERMRALGYGRWDVCLNEHVLRAVEAQVVAAEAGARAAERFVCREEHKGFVLIRPTLAALKEMGSTALADVYTEFLGRLGHHAGLPHVAARPAALHAAG